MYRTPREHKVYLFWESVAKLVLMIAIGILAVAVVLHKTFLLWIAIGLGILSFSWFYAGFYGVFLIISTVAVGYFYGMWWGILSFFGILFLSFLIADKFDL